MKACTSCRESKDESAFSWASKASGRLRSKCKDCENAIARLNWLANADLRARNASNKKKRKELAREFVLEYLQTHPCKDCGESDPVVLEFDHLSDKCKNISDMVDKAYGLITIQLEIQKCEIVCANCHRRRTASRGSWYRTK